MPEERPEDGAVTAVRQRQPGAFHRRPRAAEANLDHRRGFRQMNRLAAAVQIQGLRGQFTRQDSVIGIKSPVETPPRDGHVGAGVPQPPRQLDASDHLLARRGRPAQLEVGGCGRETR